MDTSVRNRMKIYGRYFFDCLHVTKHNGPANIRRPIKVEIVIQETQVSSSGHTFSWGT